MTDGDFRAEANPLKDEGHIAEVAWLVSDALKSDAGRRLMADGTWRVSSIAQLAALIEAQEGNRPKSYFKCSGEVGAKVTKLLGLDHD